MELLQQLGKKMDKNCHIPRNISATTGPIFTILSPLVDMYERIIKLVLVLWSLRGRCYRNQLILGAFCKRRKWLLSIFALAFLNKCNIVSSMHALIAVLKPLHFLKTWRRSICVTSGVFLPASVAQWSSNLGATVQWEPGWLDRKGMGSSPWLVR